MREAAESGRGSSAQAAVVAVLAVVCAPDGVRLVEVAGSRRAAITRVAEYVRRHAEDRLWPADAARVRRLLDRGMLDAAVRHYFAAPARWDEEWLHWSTTESGRPNETTADAPRDARIRRAGRVRERADLPRAAGVGRGARGAGHVDGRA